MFINLVIVMRNQGITDAALSSQLDMSEAHFIDCKVGLMQFSKCERLALALLLGYPAEWLFERL